MGLKELMAKQDFIDQILMVENDAALRSTVAAALTLDGHRVVETGDGAEALRLLETNVFQAVITDLHHPGPGAIDLLGYVNEHMPGTPVIVITGFGSVDVAVEAMRQGAFDFLEKPLNIEHLRLTLTRALERASLGHAYDYLRHEQPYIYRLDKILALSPAMAKVVDQVRKVAGTDLTVMLTGESGTGKSLIAGAIHANSTRRDKTLVTVNCAALTETILESELFGHEKGAFTGAHKARTGRIQQAHQGTLFLDEVGDMSPSTQAKILTAIEEKIIQRVGGGRQIRVDVRIIAATNRDLLAAVAEGRFREDLYYRLNVTHIHLPPLRERPEDVLPLAEKFLKRMCRELKRPPVGLSDEAKERLKTYNWPGNIRELRNVIERAVLFAAGPEITEEDLSLHRLRPGPGATPLESGLLDTLDLKTLERRAIETALARSDYVQRRAAELLGITPRALVYKLDKLGIDHPRLKARRRRKR